MPSTVAEYPNSNQQTRTTLRHTIREVMVRIHRISPELAAYHVREMDDTEVERRFRSYAGTESSVAGPKTEPVNVSSTRFSRPATMTAGPRHSTLFPQSGTSLPDSEVENRGKLAP
jgi:hypothetical protein